MKKLSKFENLMLFLLPIVVFFSYYPLIKLGENDSMFFELSLPIIWLAIFGTVSLVRMPKIAKNFGLAKSLVICAFPTYATLAILWSGNKLRGVLTAGILWLIIFSVVNIIEMKLTKEYLKRLLKVYLISAAVACGVCLLQCILDVFGAPREATLLCEGCTYSIFGFPHPNGFAIEPQFMGNLLIAPALIALGLFYYAIKTKKDKRTMFGFGALSFLYIMVLYITFSRGALYAFGVAGVLFGIILLIRDKKATAFWMLVPAVLGFVFGLLAQGVFAEISPTSENFAQGIQRSIHQVSLGKIDIREKVDGDGNESSFSGYVEESTDIRVGWTETAIKAWKDTNIWFGVGLGSAGTAMSKYTNGSKREIIQNEYINILTELGIVGVIILIATVIYILKTSKKLGFVIIYPIVAAYLITLCFFSGFPNVLHLYLLTPVVYHLGHKRLLC